MFENIIIIWQLIASGADVNIRNQDDFSPLSATAIMEDRVGAYVILPLIVSTLILLKKFLIYKSSCNPGQKLSKDKHDDSDPDSCGISLKSSSKRRAL